MDSREKLKKHLTENQKLSEKDADDKLAALSDDDVEKELARLAADDGDDDTEETDKKDKKMAARRELETLLARADKASSEARLAAARGSIRVRLGKLVADQRLTPGEAKKIDIEKLAKGSKETRDAVLASYNDREPVIFANQFGSVAAVERNVIELSAHESMQDLELAMRTKMTSLGPNRLKNFSEATVVEGPVVKEPPKVKTEGGLDHTSVMSHLTAIQGQVEAGDTEAALSHIRQLIDMWAAYTDDELPPPGDATSNEMASLAQQINSLTTLLGQTKRLVTTLTA